MQVQSFIDLVHFHATISMSHTLALLLKIYHIFFLTALIGSFPSEDLSYFQKYIAMLFIYLINQRIGVKHLEIISFIYIKILPHRRVFGIWVGAE